MMIYPDQKIAELCAEVRDLKTALAVARAEGIAEGRAEERERIAKWHEAESDGEYRIARDNLIPDGIRQNSVVKMATHSMIAKALRSLPPSADGGEG